MLLRDSKHGGALACLNMPDGSAKVVRPGIPDGDDVEVWLHVRQDDGRRRVYAASAQFANWASECHLPGEVWEVVRALARAVETGEEEYDDSGDDRYVISAGFPFPPPPTA